MYVTLTVTSSSMYVTLTVTSSSMYVTLTVTSSSMYVTLGYMHSIFTFFYIYSSEVNSYFLCRLNYSSLESEYIKYTIIIIINSLY